MRHNPCPSSISLEEKQIRWQLIKGEISENKFKQRYKELLKAGKIRRNGRVINGTN